MSTSVTLPEDKIEFIAKSDKEIRIERRIASLEAEMHRACRIHDRRDDFIEMIDWTSMTIDDRETIHRAALPFFCLMLSRSLPRLPPARSPWPNGQGDASPVRAA